MSFDRRQLTKFRHLLEYKQFHSAPAGMYFLPTSDEDSVYDGLYFPHRGRWRGQVVELRVHMRSKRVFVRNWAELVPGVKFVDAETGELNVQQASNATLHAASKAAEVLAVVEQMLVNGGGGGDGDGDVDDASRDPLMSPPPATGTGDHWKQLTDSEYQRMRQLVLGVTDK